MSRRRRWTDNDGVTHVVTQPAEMPDIWPAMAVVLACELVWRIGEEEAEEIFRKARKRGPEKSKRWAEKIMRDNQRDPSQLGVVLRYAVSSANQAKQDHAQKSRRDRMPERAREAWERDRRSVEGESAA